MHELGVVIEVVKTVEDFARKHGVTEIDSLVLQIGELSSIVPKYVEDCFPAAADGTLLQKAKLKIEIVPGDASCGKCGRVFNIVRNKGACPACGSEDWEPLSGKEFVIKEIVAC
jgi:hydrogenase nickel incorporation protein HypA/HybF